MKTFVEAASALASGEKDNDSELKEQVLSTLDLSDISSLIRRSKGFELAHTLSLIMDRSKDVNLDIIPVKPKEDLYVYGEYPQGKIEIVLQDDGRWLFSQHTLEALPEILEGLVEVPILGGVSELQSQLPLTVRINSHIPEFLKGSFLLEYWQWLGIFIFIVIGSVADKFLAWFLERRVNRLKKRYKNYHEVEDDILRPLGLMAMAFIWWFGSG